MSDDTEPMKWSQRLIEIGWWAPSAQYSDLLRRGMDMARLTEDDLTLLSGSESGAVRKVLDGEATLSATRIMVALSRAVMTAECHVCGAAPLVTTKECSLCCLEN